MKILFPLLFLTLPAFSQPLTGHFQAKLVTLNPHINGTIPGSANFYRLGTQVYTYVRIFAGRSNAWHLQNVYEGSRCPTVMDDLNLDGFIDIQEAEAVMGKKIIPLDGDIRTQKAGIKLYPTADESGSYYYEKLANYTTFMKDLRSRDTNPKDDLIKLGRNKELELGTRTVLIQGVTANVNFPDTVATKGTYFVYQSIPIACGKFVKIKKRP